MKKRMISIVLCLMLAVGLLPLAALAADISSVSVSDIDHPVDGKVLDTSYTIPSGKGYAKQSGSTAVTWYDQGTGGFKAVKSYDNVTGTKLDAGAKAAAGHYYVAELRLSRTGSYMFPKKEFSVTVSDDMAKRVMDKQGWSKSAADPSYDGAVYLYYKADLVYGDFNPIFLSLDKDFNGCLLAGEAQWTAADFTNASWMQTATDFDLTVAWKQGGHALSDGEKFVAARDYTLVLTFDAAKTTRHATFENGDWYVTINDDHYVAPTITNNGLTATAEFTFPCKDKITALDITGIEIPVAGQPMQTEGFNATPAAVKSVEWYKYIGAVDAPTSGNFEPNTTYYAKLTLTPSAGYAFVLDKSKVEAELGDVIYYALLDNGDAEVRIRFSVGEVPDVIISEAEITINAPKLETAPSWLASADGAGYQVFADDGGSYISGVSWMDVTEDNALTDDERVLRTHPDDEFRPGHTYRLTVELIAQDGYTFTESTAGVINGETTETMLQGDVLRVTYTFAPLPTLNALKVTIPPDKTAYRPGESFDPTGMVVTASYGDILYRDLAAGDLVIAPTGPLTKDDKAVTISYTDAEGVTRSVELEIDMIVLTGLGLASQPEKTEYTAGETFDPTGMVVQAIYSDGSTAAVTDYTVPTEPLKEGDTEIIVSYTENDITVSETVAVTVKKSAKVLKSIEITAAPDQTEYKAGESFDPAGMVVTATYDDESSAEVTGWTYTPDGALAESDTTITVSYTEGEVTLTAEQVITVVPAGKVNPFFDVSESDDFYDAVMWAYYAEPQVTTGIHEDEFGPYSTVKRGQAVTFLWRAMGCPEPETAENPFEDVKEGQYYYKAVLWAVEQGITKGTSETEFSPMQDLSTAHIITFLYRTLNSGEDGWYQIAEAWAKGAGLLKGIDIEVRPKVDCPRCNVVQFLYRALAEAE